MNTPKKIEYFRAENQKISCPGLALLHQNTEDHLMIRKPFTNPHGSQLRSVFWSCTAVTSANHPFFNHVLSLPVGGHLAGIAAARYVWKSFDE
ncbi:MAG: hypothetical protein OER87_00495 [Gammaproteobacteria bacterium]|nr:hypothetical protein [Gammaproteobacteria bacterium]